MDPTLAPRDANRITGLIGLDSTDDTKTAPAAVDPVTNRLLVNATISGGGAGGTASTDDSAFTAGTGNGTPIMGFATSDSVDSGDVGVLGMLTNRQLKVTLFDSGGSELSVGGGTQYTEDAAAAANPVGTALNLIRDDARSGSITTTDGDNLAARGTNAGELYVKHVDSIAVTNAGLTALNGAISGTEVQVDVLTMPTTTVQATNLDIRDLVFASDKVDVSGSTLGANSGTDIGDVTINNASGAAAVNIQDGGNSLTVDQATAANLNAQVVGDVAAAATDSGNPVKVGAKFNSTLPTYTDGQRGDLQIEARGVLRISQTFTTNAWTAAADNADGVAVSATANKGVVVARNTIYNGTSWDRQLGDATNGTLVNLGANNDITGTIASAASDTDNNVVKTGTKYNATQPTFTDGQRGEFQIDARGNQRTTLMAGGTTTAANYMADNADGVAVSATVNKLTTMARNTVYNGTSWDRQVGNATDGTLVNLGTNNDVTVTAAVITGGGVADDGTTPGNPIMVGGFAISPDGTDPGSVSAEADVARFRTDLNRRLLVNTEHPRSLHKHLDGSTAYTDESIVADPGDGFQVIITSIIGSTGAATALNFFLEEGSTKIFGPIYLEAVAGRGFASGPIRLPVTASTAVTLTSSASIAQSFDIDYYIQAV